MYCELMNTCDFYNHFNNYEYMLLHQLDVLVFSSNINNFQKNLAKAYRESLEDISNKIPETLRNLGKLDEKIEKTISF